MAFKQNLPVYGIFGLIAVAAVGGVLYLQPSDDERLEAEVASYAKTRGDVQDVQREGPVATYLLRDGTLLHAEFSKQGGKWTFSRDLFQEFQKTVNDPRVEAEVLGRLAQRIHDRFRTQIQFKEGLKKTYVLFRDDRGLAGRFVVRFQYPGKGENRPLGEYAELFRYADGTWASEGGGSLLDQVPKSP